MLPRTFIEVTLTYVFTTFAAAHFCSRSFANSAMVPEVLCVAHNKLLTLFLCDLSSYPPPPRRYPDPKLPASSQARTRASRRAVHFPVRR